MALAGYIIYALLSVICAINAFKLSLARAVWPRQRKKAINLLEDSGLSADVRQALFHALMAPLPRYEDIEQIIDSASNDSGKFHENYCDEIS